MSAASKFSRGDESRRSSARGTRCSISRYRDIEGVRCRRREGDVERGARGLQRDRVLSASSCSGFSALPRSIRGRPSARGETKARAARLPLCHIARPIRGARARAFRAFQRQSFRHISCVGVGPHEHPQNAVRVSSCDGGAPLRLRLRRRSPRTRGARHRTKPRRHRRDKFRRQGGHRSVGRSAVRPRRGMQERRPRCDVCVTHRVHGPDSREHRERSERLRLPARGLDSDAVDRCMAAIKSEECSHPFDTLTRHDKCRTNAMCMK